MSIEPMLVISTSHLPEDAMNRLKRQAEVEGRAPAVTRAIPHDYGVIVFVSELENTTQEPELQAVIDYVRKSGCYWINLDRDADKIEDLPTWEW
jgi:hypothetical protein